MKIIMPWRRNVVPLNQSFYFLAGPGQGGGDWQREACELIFKVDPESTIAVPHRYDDEHILARHFYEDPSEDPSTDVYLGQTHWERYYLEMALIHAKGVIIFWLPEQSRTNPRADGQPYAIQTYGELGELRGRTMECDNTKQKRLVVGAMSGFPGLAHIQQNFNLAFKRSHPNGFPIFTTLDNTIRQGFLVTQS